VTAGLRVELLAKQLRGAGEGLGGGGGYGGWGKVRRWGEGSWRGRAGEE
jgi:hypothetical protein